MFKNFFWSFILEKWFGSIRINGSVNKAMDHIKKKCLVGIFPEAGRTRTGKLQKVTHTGLGITALISKYPVVPVGLVNSFQFWPPQKKLPSFKRILKINIGKPMIFRKKVSKKNAKIINRKVMQEIAKLTGQKYPY